MIRGFAFLLILGVASGCGKWVKSSAMSPVPDGAFKASDFHLPVAHPQPYFCACGNLTGALWNSHNGEAPGWACWYRSKSGYNSFCKVGDYTVLVTKFPSSTGPREQNSTNTHPVPSNAIPLHKKQNPPAFACAFYTGGVNQGVKGVIPGGLMVDGGSGSYLCQAVYPSQTDYRNTIYVTAVSGQYVVPSGSVCLI
eukprot:TRINITY_DN67110_c9_g6_i1.p1 TRINITY_DN67110_c9_g6~~TRINITY_DN67110_c9_g6_i1.p1  ORF type:complete len:196 (-),score=20.31 TRINITY_DN67110_c9_g6_i1:99-686(-)